MERHLRELREKASMLEGALVKAGVMHKLDSYAPETAEQKLLVNEYESVKTEAQRAAASLPSALTRAASIFISDNGPGPARAIYGDEISAECHDVLRKAYRLFQSPSPMK
jgi:hypothetical protein